MVAHQAVLDNNLDKLETLIEVTSDKCTRGVNKRGEIFTIFGEDC